MTRRGGSLEPPKPRHAKRLAKDGGETSRSAYFWLKFPNIDTTNLHRGPFSVSINCAVRPFSLFHLFWSGISGHLSPLATLRAPMRNCHFSS